MRSRYAIREPYGTYFVTSTIVEWLPVFTTAACCEILVKSLLHCREHKGHQVWREGVHPQQIGSDEMTEQKIDYIHNNPVLRGLVVAPEHWRYSSAHEWLTGGHPLFTCDHWR
jgi:hypothetical protein